MRIFLPITFLLILALSSCLQEHEARFFDLQTERILVNQDSVGKWQLVVFKQDGNEISLNECERANSLNFSRLPNIFQEIDLPPFCFGNGGIIAEGEWEVIKEEDDSNPRLRLIYSANDSDLFHIEELTPATLSLRLRPENHPFGINEERVYRKIN
jgi:hypothetical protein